MWQMIKLFSRQSTEAPELLSSQLFDQNTTYPAILRDLANAKHEIVIESPFISPRRAEALYPSFRKAAKRGVLLIINTRHPDEHDGEYVHYAAEVITRLQEMGTKVLFTGGHHRKLAIFDRSVLWEGSLNLLSQTDSCEIMRRISSEVLAQEMIRFTGLDKYI
jgi:phosphatidylserine/phosphatidylglycerophosphate/cardiolipin synthase-like enzyme